MHNLPQELHGVPFFLERIGRRVGSSVDHNFVCFQFDALTRALRFHQFPSDRNGRTCSHSRQDILGNGSGLDHDLQVSGRGAILQLNEVNSLAVTPGLHPTQNRKLRSRSFGQDVFDITAVLNQVVLLQCLPGLMCILRPQYFRRAAALLSKALALRGQAVHVARE